MDTMWIVALAALAWLWALFLLALFGVGRGGEPTMPPVRREDESAVPETSSHQGLLPPGADELLHNH
jgi:hypothetical protein